MGAFVRFRSAFVRSRLFDIQSIPGLAGVRFCRFVGMFVPVCACVRLYTGQELWHAEVCLMRIYYLLQGCSLLRRNDSLLGIFFSRAFCFFVGVFRGRLKVE